MCIRDREDPVDTGHGTTITKTESRGRPHDADFTEYVAARQGQMLRFAYLLTGQRAEAEDLLQTAFAKLYLAWWKVDVESSRDAYVRTILVRENASTWRRLWRRREQSVGAVSYTHLDVYKRQVYYERLVQQEQYEVCLLYTSRCV